MLSRRVKYIALTCDEIGGFSLQIHQAVDKINKVIIGKQANSCVQTVTNNHSVGVTVVNEKQALRGYKKWPMKKKALYALKGSAMWVAWEF